MTPDVLIPRPETEILVVEVLKQFPSHTVLKGADLGTGSGAIALALAHERPHWDIYAVDFSHAALEIARHNAERFHLTQVHFIQSDWFSAMPQQQFDVICSNPPYIAEDEMAALQIELSYEPQTALVAKDFGLAEICTIITEGRFFLKEGGMLFLEHGATQAEAVQRALAMKNYSGIYTLKDYSDRPRVTVAQYFKS